MFYRRSRESGSSRGARMSNPRGRSRRRLADTSSSDLARSASLPATSQRARNVFIFESNPLACRGAFVRTYLARSARPPRHGVYGKINSRRENAPPRPATAGLTSIARRYRSRCDCIPELHFHKWNSSSAIASLVHPRLPFPEREPRYLKRDSVQSNARCTRRSERVEKGRSVRFQ